MNLPKKETCPGKSHNETKLALSIKFKSHEIRNAFGHAETRSMPDVPKGKENLYLDTVCQYTGALNAQLGQQLMQQAIYASPFAKEIEVEAEAVAAALGEMKPQDAVEGMIVTQMVGLHNQMMYYMRKSLDEDFNAEMYINRFTKLNRLFQNCLHTLLKYRNRGQQKVVVENVVIGQGGQAIVGNVESPRNS